MEKNKPRKPLTSLRIKPKHGYINSLITINRKMLFWKIQKHDIQTVNYITHTHLFQQNQNKTKPNIHPSNTFLPISSTHPQPLFLKTPPFSQPPPLPKSGASRLLGQHSTSSETRNMVHRPSWKPSAEEERIKFGTAMGCQQRSFDDISQEEKPIQELDSKGLPPVEESIPFKRGGRPCTGHENVTTLTQASPGLSWIVLVTERWMMRVNVRNHCNLIRYAIVP